MIKYNDFINEAEQEHRIDTSAVDPELVHKASRMDKDSFDKLAKGVYSRSFKIADKNTSEELKPMDLNHLVKNFDMIEKFAEKFGYTFRYFTSNPDQVRTIKDGTKIELRPKDIKKEGYQKGYIYGYMIHSILMAHLTINYIQKFGDKFMN